MIYSEKKNTESELNKSQSPEYIIYTLNKTGTTKKTPSATASGPGCSSASSTAPSPAASTDSINVDAVDNAGDSDDSEYEPELLDFDSY